MRESELERLYFEASKRSYTLSDLSKPGFLFPSLLVTCQANMDADMYILLEKWAWALTAQSYVQGRAVRPKRRLQVAFRRGRKSVSTNSNDLGFLLPTVTQCPFLFPKDTSLSEVPIKNSLHSLGAESSWFPGSPLSLDSGIFLSCVPTPLAFRVSS